MESWWDDLEQEVLTALRAERPAAPARIGQKLGLSEAAVASVLTMLATEGKVRIRLVDLP